jgi:predicted site-specific integrase-resolvase
MRRTMYRDAKMSSYEDLIPQKEILARLHVTIHTIRRWRRDGKSAPPCYPINGRVYYRASEVEAWLRDHRR